MAEIRSECFLGISYSLPVPLARLPVPACACLCLPVRGTQTGGARRQASPADRESLDLSIAIPIAIANERGMIPEG